VKKKSKIGFLLVASLLILTACGTSEVTANSSDFWEKLVYFFGNAYCAQLTLPIQSELTIPEDVKFVYLGDFTIKCSMPFYDISEIKRIDNFDAAALAVKKAYGKSAELERIPLVPLKK